MSTLANNDSISRPNSRPKLPFPGNGKGKFKMPREGKGREIWGMHSRESRETGIPAHPWLPLPLSQFPTWSLVDDKVTMRVVQDTKFETWQYVAMWPLRDRLATELSNTDQGSETRPRIIHAWIHPSQANTIKLFFYHNTHMMIIPSKISDVCTICNKVIFFLYLFTSCVYSGNSSFWDWLCFHYL